MQASAISLTSVRSVRWILSVLLLLASCQSSDNGNPAPVPTPLRIQLSPQQTQSALATWSDAVLRIDGELIAAEAGTDKALITTTRYRKAFAAEVLGRLRTKRYTVIVVDSENPPMPTPLVLSTYGYVFHNDTGNWAALIQVPRSENPDLFTLFEAVAASIKD